MQSLEEKGLLERYSSFLLTLIYLNLKITVLLHTAALHLD